MMETIAMASAMNFMVLWRTRGRILAADYYFLERESEEGDMTMGFGGVIMCGGARW